MGNHDDVPTLLSDLDAATRRLVATIERLRPDDLSGPSLLPGWSRAHLLTHIARNADGGRNLLLSLRSGSPVPMYPSLDLRAADIDTGASRPADVVLADAVASSQRFVVDAQCTAPEVWNAQLPSGAQAPGLSHAGTRPLTMRLREVEFHHVDLASSYGFGQTPPSLLDSFLDDTITRLARKGVGVRAESAAGPDMWAVEAGGTSQTVAGARADVMAWLSGRSAGGQLGREGPLPPIPALD